jgi:hypothetical protein
VHLKKEIIMFYVKNVPVWERMLRVLLGVAAIAASVLFLRDQWAIIGGISAGIFILTGLFGFCPMCAMVGRKLK